jgi:Cft2 family RNA processing exonuclease
MGTRRDFGSFALTLLPAGHVLGSAQALVDHGGQRLLYSGDFKLAPSRTAEPAVTAEADTLVVEATFGRPHYRFPPVEQVREAIVAFCRESLADGCTPVLLAYSLGKGQELLGCLADAGLDIAVHGPTHEIAHVYARLGAEFPAHNRLDGRAPDGAVVICPPQALRSLAVPRRMRTAAVTGWAVDRSTRYRMGVDAAFPLSDHAGYDDLVEYVRRVNPRRVYTVYGFAADFAADLCTLGYYARPLQGPMQARLL